MTTPTTNYGWIKPDIGASTDAWGGLLNTDLDGIDSTVKSVSNVANAALPSATASSTYVAKAGDTMTGNLTAPNIFTTGAAGVTSAGLMTINAAAGVNRAYQWQTAGSSRWSLYTNTTAEGGSNAGSDLAINSFTDAGAFLASPLGIKRSTGVATFAVAIVNGSSDRRLKENILPLEGSLDKVMALQGVSFNMIETPDKPEIGLIAQDVEPVVPEVIQSYQFAGPEGKTSDDFLAIDYPKLVAHLIEAVKTLAARVEALEALQAPAGRG